MLFLAVYRLNPDYVMVLFDDPMGKQMLAGGVVMQILVHWSSEKSSISRCNTVFLAAIITFEKLMPVAIFGLFAIVSYWILTLLAGRRTARFERLDEIRQPMRRGEKAQKQDDAVSKMLEKASPLAKPLQPKTEKEVGRLKQRLGYAGFRNESAVSVFLGMKFIGLMIGLFVCGGPF